MTSAERAAQGRDEHDLVAWYRSMTPRERVYVAFELSEIAAELVRQGATPAGK